ncbi:IS3 family transposase [Aeromicrobium piscarium]|uniref:IS3 family transposase n=1 Tax=Aeromicrobium piscarium TaxID=2590901 RepID=A0A554RGD4_9ACTN|nr:IS3 family transposase [Aeromicrobium piscarium]
MTGPYTEILTGSWRSRPPSARDIADAHLLNTIRDIHAASRQTYGVRRVHAELRLGRRTRCSRGRVERLMVLGGLQGVHRRRWRHAGGRAPAVFEDHVKREFVADAPDKLWVTDIPPSTSCREVPPPGTGPVKGGSTALR